MRSSIATLTCLVLLALASSGTPAASRDGAERRSNQDSDELRTDMRQRRLKKVEDLDKHRLPGQSGAATSTPAPRPQTNPQN